MINSNTLKSVLVSLPLNELKKKTSGFQDLRTLELQARDEKHIMCYTQNMHTPTPTMKTNTLKEVTLFLENIPDFNLPLGMTKDNGQGVAPSRVGSRSLSVSSRRIYKSWTVSSDVTTMTGGEDTTRIGREE